MAVWLVLVLNFVTFVLSQATEDLAPGDGDAVCVQEVVDGVMNPFFSLHPTYPANERPLMDSRDYTGLLQARNPPVWQQVDNDTNNSLEKVTEVRKIMFDTCVCRIEGSIYILYYIYSFIIYS